MSPMVTLLKEPWATRTMVFGKKRFIFRGGDRLSVSVAVALVCKSRKDEAGKPLFKVEGLPVIVKAVHPPVENILPCIKNEITVPRQRKLVECRL